MMNLDFAMPFLGALLCLLAMAQLGFWAAQSFRISSQNEKQFELAKELLREQITNRNRQPQSTAISESSAPANAKSSKAFRKLQVVKTVRETGQCLSVYMRPVDGQPVEDFKAGQHLPIRLSIPGQPKPVIRCYSLSNAAGDGVYRISVKAVPAPLDQPNTPPGFPPPPGLVSNYINQHVNVGDIIEAKSPAGSFVMDRESAGPVVMLAGGVGITPMVSMIQEAIAQNDQRMMVLVYGCVNRQEQAFREWLEEQLAGRDNLVLINCFSSPLPTETMGQDYQVSGYVSVELLQKLLPDNQCDFYLCGPPPFMASLTKGLADWGVDDTKIRSESFGPASRKATTAPAVAAANAQTVNVSFAQSNIEQVFDGSRTILEMAEAAGVEMDSGCRAGSCESCLTKLLKGSVSYPDGDPGCEAGECLPCIAVPQSDVVLDA